MGHSAMADPSAGTGGGALGAVDRAMHRLEKLTALMSGYGIFGLMLIGVAQILSRKILNWPIFGYIDMVEIAMSFVVFLALAYTERLGGHIRMEIIVSFLKGRALWLFELIGVVIGLFIVALLIMTSWQHAMRAYTAGDSTIDAQFPLWPSKMVVPFALALLFVRLLISLWAYLRLIGSPDAPVVGVAELIDAEEQALREAQSAIGATGVGDLPAGEPGPDTNRAR